MVDNSIVPEFAGYMALYVQQWHFSGYQFQMPGRATLALPAIRVDSSFSQPCLEGKGQEQKHC